MTEIRPTEDRLVLQPISPEDRTKGGIILPDAAKGRAQKGKVLAVGPGRVLEDGTRVPVGPSVGDTVLFSQYAGGEVEIDGEKFRVVDEREVLAILVEKQPAR